VRIKISTVFVDDQSAARSFYTEVLGFQVHTDADYGPGARWLTVVSTEEPNGTELLLAPAEAAARDHQKAIRDAGKPATSFSTDDIQREYERMVAAGVTFVMPPTTMGYGGIDAVFDDTCGNLINLHQDGPDQAS
jgi:predicted enzyme related to lactoylglutathione lyase